MPALIPTAHVGTITWLGRVENRQAALASRRVQELVVGLDGPEGEAHGGLTRPSCSRVLGLYPRGTTIRNTRQITLVSAEELAGIAAEMALDRLDPALMGAGMVLSGIPDFSHLPPSSRLQAEGGATLVVDMQNRPCVLPAKEIDHLHPGKGRLFKRAAERRRGVTAWIEREGVFRLGETVRLHVPDQRPWAASPLAGS